VGNIKQYVQVVLHNRKIENGNMKELKDAKIKASSSYQNHRKKNDTKSVYLPQNLVTSKLR
jgi:hypothetical protein